jgi:hypothetical protein
MEELEKIYLYPAVEKNTEKPPLEALFAAARKAGHRTPFNNARSVFKNPQKGGALVALAEMIMKYEPDLVLDPDWDSDPLDFV